MRLKNNCMSEPAIVISKPSPGNVLPMKLCCASSAESLESAEALRDTGPALNVQKDATEQRPGIEGSCSSVGEYVKKPSANIHVTPLKTPAVKPLSVDTDTPSFQAQQSLLGNEQTSTFGQTEMAALTPLHIDSTVFDSSVHCSPLHKVRSASFGSHDTSLIGPAERLAEQINCSRFIDALDVQSPARFTRSVSSSTPYKLLKEEEPAVSKKTAAAGGTSHEKVKSSLEVGSNVENQTASSPTRQEAEKRRVADHIQHFNKLTLYSPTGSKSKQTRSPLKFQRTPVRQTVRRINSLSGDSRRFNVPVNVTKSLSLESGLSPHSKLLPQVRPSNSSLAGKKPPPLPPKRPSTLVRKPASCALGDVTNKVQPLVKVERSTSDPSETQTPVQQRVEKDSNYYRGSPRNPLHPGRLLSATKPVDL